ncbi:MAG: hypothetical protein K9G59_18170 [Caulobacter sp.]|nr:hypothetical protein [Caulobacter sp.]
MSRPTLLALAICALVAPVALAQPTSGPTGGPTTVSPAIVTATPAKATRGKDRPDEIVCKRQPISGTRVLGPKTCLMRREWKAMEGRGMEEVEAAIRAARTSNCAGC